MAVPARDLANRAAAAERERDVARLRMAARHPGCSIGSYGGGVLAPENVVVSKPWATRWAAKAQRNAKAAIAFRPLRTRHANRAPRARAAKRSPQSTSARDRDGPHLGGDDDDPPRPPLADFHPHQGVTAVGRALMVAMQVAT
jgi:hypothetical protein